VRNAIIDMLKPYAAHVHTITADSGAEFVEHRAIAKALDTDFYFAHPYSSWERGLNEDFTACFASTFRRERICGRSLRKMSGRRRSN
jgi:IS30 family transposase